MRLLLVNDPFLCVLNSPFDELVAGHGEVGRAMQRIGTLFHVIISHYYTLFHTTINVDDLIAAGEIQNMLGFKY
jgi:hypothetical protein